MQIGMRMKGLRRNDVAHCVAVGITDLELFFSAGNAINFIEQVGIVKH